MDRGSFNPPDLSQELSRLRTEMHKLEQRTLDRDLQVANWSAVAMILAALALTATII